MALDNFGQQFAVKTLRKFYQTAVTPAITNTDYEGDIKQAGDRVNILSFLGDLTLSDYTAGSDMSTESIYDTNDQLVVAKRKYYNFPIDRLEDLFTYADDIADTLVENASKTLERTIDTYVLENAGVVKAGNWVGLNFRVIASAGDTQASIATSATGGSIVVQSDTTATSTNNVAGQENPADGLIYFTGFTTADINKPIRLTSGSTWATEWYRITSITSSIEVAVTNWDGNTDATGDIPNGDVLRGLYGGQEFTSDQNGDGKPTTQEGWGWELQAAAATSVSASNVYAHITKLAERLNFNEVPDSDRHLTVTPYLYELLQRASELQPAIAMAYEPIVINGRVGRVAGFEVHMAAGARVSTRAGHPTSTAGAATKGADTVLTTGATGHQILANHITFCTFAYKWAESRIVDAESQFAKKYQGLHLYGALVPAVRRKAGATLFMAA